MTVTAINVFVEVDGQQCLAIIDPAMASSFMHMLPAFQKGQPDDARLSALPDEVAEHLIKLRRTLLERIKAKRTQAQKAADVAKQDQEPLS